MAEETMEKNHQRSHCCSSIEHRQPKEKIEYNAHTNERFMIPLKALLFERKQQKDVPEREYIYNITRTKPLTWSVVEHKRYDGDRGTNE